jgi:hypothetical protein
MNGNSLVPVDLVSGFESFLSYLETKDHFGAQEVILLYHLQSILNEIRPGLSGAEATSLRIRLQLLGSPQSRNNGGPGK